MRMLLRAAIVGVGLCTAVAAQQPKPPATPSAAPPATAPKQPQPSARPRVTPTPAASVIVRDHDGSPIPDVKVIATGPSNQQVTTGRDGTATLSALRDGSYRLRFERQDFNTFEREVTIRGRQTEPIEVWLSNA